MVPACADGNAIGSGHRSPGDRATRPLARPHAHTRPMPLEEYRRKRDFAKTPEPAPGQPAAPAPRRRSARRRFVVQRHRATRLHYDFRLEIDGVLASWAVPKGPTLDPTIRRMAVHVEDHPMEYFDFEGVIPAKQYGAGDVIVWDWGTWEPEAETPDPAAAVANGELKFVLVGREGEGPLHDRPHEPPARHRAAHGVRGRRGRAVAADPQARRRQRRRAGTPRTTRRASSRAARTTRSRPTPRRSGSPRRPRRPPRSTCRPPARRRCRATSSR